MEVEGRDAVAVMSTVLQQTQWESWKLSHKMKVAATRQPTVILQGSTSCTSHNTHFQKDVHQTIQTHEQCVNLHIDSVLFL